MKQTVWFLRGLPGSGKTTWAKKQVANSGGKIKRVNKDDLRSMLDAGKYSKENEKFVLGVRDAIIYDALYKGYSIIIDDTNFEPVHKGSVEALVSNYRLFSTNNIEFVEKYFPIDPTEACKRQEYRPKDEQVPHEVIWKMYDKYIKPYEYPNTPVLKQDTSLPKAIICDLDGTLAIHQGRSPYDCMKAEEDVINEAVANLLWKYEDDGYEIIFVSGRNAECYDVTTYWLVLNGFKSYKLFLREPDDRRKDSIIKKEIFYNFIYNNWFVELVLDDRDQVVRMWRQEIGLPCFQVNYGNF